MEVWSYQSVIGKLNYLAQMARLDISMALCNCARYTTVPTYLHEQAVKRIGRYLATTRGKGLIFCPTTMSTLDMYVDANFAGTWNKEFLHLLDCVLSRTGFVILYHGCPIHWGSKLQSAIALSTNEAEYIALSMSARKLIPIWRVLRELTLHSPLRCCLSHQPGHLPPSTIFEDNAFCIAFAMKDIHHKPRMKHISLKYHHFKDYVQIGTLQIVKVPTASNIADIFTKPLNQALHEHLQFTMMGWWTPSLITAPSHTHIAKGETVEQPADIRWTSNGGHWIPMFAYIQIVNGFSWKSCHEGVLGSRARPGVDWLAYQH